MIEVRSKHKSSKPRLLMYAAHKQSSMRQNEKFDKMTNSFHFLHAGKVEANPLPIAATDSLPAGPAEGTPPP